MLLPDRVSNPVGRKRGAFFGFQQQNPLQRTNLVCNESVYVFCMCIFFRTPSFDALLKIVGEMTQLPNNFEESIKTSGAKKQAHTTQNFPQYLFVGTKSFFSWEPRENMFLL